MYKLVSLYYHGYYNSLMLVKEGQSFNVQKISLSQQSIDIDG